LTFQKWTYLYLYVLLDIFDALQDRGPALVGPGCLERGGRPILKALRVIEPEEERWSASDLAVVGVTPNEEIKGVGITEANGAREVSHNVGGDIDHAKRRAKAVTVKSVSNSL
jgi:hypothetical protein